MTVHGRRSGGRSAALPPFQTLLDAHAATVLGFLSGRLAPADAEDCFQETWLAALRAYPALTDSANLRGWLLTIARNKLHDAQRAASRRPLAVAELPDVGVDPAKSSADADGALWEEVRGLPGKQRTAVALRFVEDDDYADIARRMGTTEDAARRNVHEGIKKLRRKRA